MAPTILPSTAAGHHVMTRDGSTVLIRPALAADRDRIVALYSSLSRESTYRRFLGFPPAGRRWVDPAGSADPLVFTLVAESSGEIVAVASYQRDPSHGDEAEVAFTVADRWQGRGLGTLLLEQMAAQAHTAGLARFRASTGADNQPMLSVFRDAGFPLATSPHAGVVDASLDLDTPGRYEDRHFERTQEAARVSMRPFFEPRGIAILGASRSASKVGGQVFRNLHHSGFVGQLYPVNGSATEIDGVPAYGRVADVPDPVDLAVIAIPSAAVPDAVDQCLARGIKALIVLSAGFAESGPEGQLAEASLVEKIRCAGARLIGPNCMGVLNNAASVRLNATFAPEMPPTGRISLSTQSGALGLAVLAGAARSGIGIAGCVSVGNKADVSGNDLLLYWGADPATDVILMYTEGFGNPRKFAEIARRTSPHKPIVVLKAGRTQAGLRAVHSHTAALATNDAIVDALLHQCGVIRVRTLEELFDTAMVLSDAPLPAGRRVAILTNAGGAGILAADTCEIEGLSVGSLDERTVRELRQFLPTAASTANPVDMIATASPADFGRAIAALVADPSVDSVIVAYVPPALSDPTAVAQAIRDAVVAAGSRKPIVVSFVTREIPPGVLATLPTCPFPERASAALARVTAYAEWRRKAAHVTTAPPAFDGKHLRTLMASLLERGERWLEPREVDEILREVGVPTMRALGCRTAEEAARAATAIGYPVVLKATGPGILHKSDVGGVRIGLRDAAAVTRAFTDMQLRLGTTMTAALVQEMAVDGPEFLVGATNDPTFGPVIAIGAGGTMAELMRDVVFRLAPLSAEAVVAAIDETRACRLLRGFRGELPRDEDALAAIVSAVSALASACPQIAELDLNPVRVYAKGARVLDARIRLARPSMRVSSKLEY